MMDPNVPRLVPEDKTEKMRFEACELSEIGFPAASLRTRVAVAVPPAVSELKLKIKVDWLGEIEPVPTVIVGKALVTEAPFTFAVIVVAVPALDAVKVAV